ncbi:uncharacterized protein L969DRAFT_42884 [Mixia osmundae IAM 14324]|uniref:FZ domain-containing protein n=1 Tax=Mixia osmundae (strain CBS 9802 / IAM 14324 / JCM 22182 / KY 12970) TaxID=764103 RepID=G7E571_MIXOS|nr:uncharacterized protein L969DRAFT_42884 [Mixia osmundae IAM 14324]KEI42662.1 hypothetical protein L969DRAFT_42884 [Mixia osmundae IAM 14324]GAA97981.1 hypothetical protein E5Q_04661 [Mixia osmundae IAM 14324]
MQRRRGRRRLLIYAALIVAYLNHAHAQTSTLSIDLPSLTKFNVSSGDAAYFYVPAVADQPSTSSAKLPYFVTLSICRAPAAVMTSAYNLTGILATSSVLVAATQMTAAAQQAEDGRGVVSAAPLGFANMTVVQPGTNNVGLWLTVNAPYVNDTTTTSWGFELGVSTSEPLHLLDRYAAFQYADSDNVSAIMTTPTYYPSTDGTPSYELILLPSTQAPNPALAHSACYLRSVAASVNNASDIQVSLGSTTRGVVTMTAREGAQGLNLRTDGTKTQYNLAGLAPETNYTIVGLQSTDQVVNGTSGVRLFQTQYFQTKQGNNCRLVDSPPFCPAVAYAVPAPPTLPTSDLLTIYESNLNASLAGFQSTLSTFSCNISSQGMYSFVRNCDDCLLAYRNWLCSTTMPRCTDIPADLLPQAVSNTSEGQIGQITFQTSYVDGVTYSDAPIPETAQPYIIRTTPTISRTPFLSAAALANLTDTNDTLQGFDLVQPFPYGEVLPCLSVCELVQASCPFPLFGWTCPLPGITAEGSYGAMQALPAPQRAGGDARSTLMQADDRYGNVYCNSLDVNVLLAKRSSSPNLAASLTLLMTCFALSLML